MANNAMPSIDYAFGFDIGGTKTVASLWRLSGELVGKEGFATRGTWREVLDRAAAIAEGLRDRAGIPREGIAGIGISCGGPLDSARGLVLSPPNLPGWDEVPIACFLEERLGAKAWLENDANACALAEWYWGAGRGCRSMVFLTFGTGLGAGLILDGRLYRGACDLAGEVGHTRLAEDGPLGYGKKGSWEGFCSGGGISRLYQERTGRNVSTKQICAEASSGNEAACEVVETSARYLGRGIALLIDILNPERIVIGSVFARNEKLFRPTMEKIIAEETLAAGRSACTVLPSELGESLGDMAALGVVLDHLQVDRRKEAR
jgi:glucokinase